MKYKMASVVAVVAAVSVAAVAHAASDDVVKGAQASVSPPPITEISNWKDVNLRSASPSNVEALTHSLADVADVREAVGPKLGTLDPKSLRVAVASEAGQVALATSASGACYTAQESFAGDPTVVCSAELHPSGIIWGIGRHNGQAHLTGVAVDSVTGVDVLNSDGAASPAKLQNNGFVWSGKDDVVSLRVHRGSTVDSVDLSAN